MNLDTYLREHKILGADFAQRLGISEASLSRIRKGAQNIDRTLIRTIVDKTGGAVTSDDLVFDEGKAA